MAKRGKQGQPEQVCSTRNHCGAAGDSSPSALTSPMTGRRDQDRKPAEQEAEADKRHHPHRGSGFAGRRQAKRDPHEIESDGREQRANHHRLPP